MLQKKQQAPARSKPEQLLSLKTVANRGVMGKAGGLGAICGEHFFHLGMLPVGLLRAMKGYARRRYGSPP